ncbi:STAS domain-containing protein [Nitratireductor sp. XY-223]|uniref:STAS domain-containing protein n=1 Tax=Hyphomicrobiales TaxID=356 RepID=UPI0010A9F570|nr:STAS domain-containing protein [Nitratireductor sp. XY-223]
MKVETQKIENALVAAVSGRLDGASASDFEEKFSGALVGHGGSVVCDLGAVPYISSAGLRAVLVIAKRLSQADRSFLVCGLSGPVAEVFRLSGFDRIILTHEDREAALAALRLSE